MCHSPSDDKSGQDFTIWSHADQPDSLSIGLYQDMPYEPPDYDEMRRKLAEVTPEEQLEAAQHYMKEMYSAKMRERMITGEITPVEAQAEVIENITSGIYDKMISRETDGSDPLVQEPKE